MKKFVVLALSLSLFMPFATKAAFGAVAQPTTVEELRADRLKSLYKRDPRAEELISKASAKAEKIKQSDAALGARMQHAIEQIACSASGEQESRIKADMEFLEAIVKDHKEPGADELAPLQERYKKICEKFDDMAFSKDLDRAMHIHDKLVRYTALGLWDKDKIASELERMEGLIERAADIAFGRIEFVNTCKNKKLTHIPKLIYLGTSPREEMYLTGDRRSVALIDEGGGTPLGMELAEYVIQSPDGKLVNFDESNNPSLGIPFSPPLSLWAKSRILDGRIPAVLLKLVDSNVKEGNPSYAASKAEFLSVTDLAGGKLDDYLKANSKHLGVEKTPALLGLLSDFDREAATAFGADGHTPFYTIMDPKLKDMPEAKRADELKKRFEKGAFVTAKSLPPELSNQYGDATTPDGPERVRDAWKHFSKSVRDNGGSSLALFSSAGSFHGNKNAAKFPAEQDAGNQAWNKLEYYWPGEGVLDWIGINGVGDDPASDPKGPNIMEAIEPFMVEHRSSTWQSTPVMLVDLAPSRSKVPLSEAPFITSVFSTIVPGTFPNILAVFIKSPDDLTLWSRDAAAAFRTNVSSNKIYSFKMRFKELK